MSFVDFYRNKVLHGLPVYPEDDDEPLREGLTPLWVREGTSDQGETFKVRVELSPRWEADAYTQELERELMNEIYVRISKLGTIELDKKRRYGLDKLTVWRLADTDVHHIGTINAVYSRIK